MKKSDSTPINWVSIDDESIFFKKLLRYSIGIHLFCLIIDLSWFSFWRPLELNEIEIEAEFLPDISKAKQESVKVETKAEEIKVQEKILAQLPKNFSVKEDTPQEEKEEILKPKDAPQETPEKDKVAQDQEEARAAKEKAVAELTKMEALERLLKEKARRDKKFADQNSAPIAANLQKRKEELEANLQKYSLGAENVESGYGKILKKWLSKFYALPEVYQLQNEQIKAIVEIILQNDGTLQTVTLTRSSNNDVFDKLALKTIQDASPFPRPPSEWVGRTITIPFAVGKN